MKTNKQKTSKLFRMFPVSKRFLSLFIFYQKQQVREPHDKGRLQRRCWEADCRAEEAPWAAGATKTAKNSPNFSFHEPAPPRLQDHINTAKSALEIKLFL